MCVFVHCRRIDRYFCQHSPQFALLIAAMSLPIHPAHPTPDHVYAVELYLSRMNFYVYAFVCAIEMNAFARNSKLVIRVRACAHVCKCDTQADIECKHFNFKRKRTMKMTAAPILLLLFVASHHHKRLTLDTYYNNLYENGSRSLTAQCLR